MAGATVALLVMLAIWFGSANSSTLIGGTLLNMAVFGAMISYVMQAASFILLRRNFPHIARPYKSPFGVAGAGLTIVLALVTIWFQLADPVYRAGVIGVAIWFAVGIAYFAAIGRHKLVLSPEEEFAMSKGEAEYKTI